LGDAPKTAADSEAGKTGLRRKKGAVVFGRLDRHPDSPSSLLPPASLHPPWGSLPAPEDDDTIGKDLAVVQRARSPSPVRHLSGPQALRQERSGAVSPTIA
jgi:hypothetical protein